MQGSNPLKHWRVTQQKALKRVTHAAVLHIRPPGQQLTFGGNAGV